MTAINGFFISLLQEKKFVYMPTCLVIERMTKLYSHLSRINSQVELAKQLKELLFLLRYFRFELRCICGAYEELRIRFFVGDWKEDRLKANKLFINLQNRITYFGDYVGHDVRKQLLDVNAALGDEWERLGGILDGRTGTTTMAGASCNTCRYFRSTNKACWQQIMAKAVLSMGGLAECREPDTYLLLLCYPRVKIQILREIEALERKYNIPDKFPAEKIMCVSDCDTSISCPSCMTMVDGLGSQHVDPRRSGTGSKTMRKPGHRTMRHFRDTIIQIPRGGMLPSALAALTRGNS